MCRCQCAAAVAADVYGQTFPAARSQPHSAEHDEQQAAEDFPAAFDDERQ